jgi:hypothetical protein
MIKVLGIVQEVITIKSLNQVISWYPNVVFYDTEALNIIGIYEENSLHKSLRLRSA